MNRNLFWGLLAAVLLTACEKGLDELGEGMSPSPTEQVTNSMLQVRTRGGSPGDETTIAYPVQVFVFQGNDCKAMQTIDGLVNMVLEQRKAAKAAKDWATSDRIRDDLKALGIQIKDTKEGTEWTLE